MDLGLLLIGHGTREPEGVAEFLRTVKLVAEALPAVAVEPCFLELAEPTIEAGFTRLLDRGVRQITAAPVLLFAAGHAREDIPAELARLAAEHPGVGVQQSPHLGCHPAILELSAERFRQGLLVEGPQISPAETLVILVGRGSRDDDATAEMHRFAGLRRDLTPVGQLEVAFVAMASPGLDEALALLDTWATRRAVRRVVVQPHLLFGGRLLDEIRAKVTQLAAGRPQYQWVLAEHLGVSPLVARAIVERSGQAIQKKSVDPTADSARTPQGA